MTHRITRVAGTVQLPVTLEQAKAHIKIDHDTEDEDLVLKLRAALEWCEETTHRAITQRSYLVVRDKFPKKDWRLPLGYIDSVTAVRYLDANGAEQTWSSANYTLDNLSNSAARVYPVPTEDWPAIGEYLGAARVEVVAGWTPANCPEVIRQAVLRRTAQLFDNRAPGDPDMATEENATRMMLAPWTLPIWA